MRLSKQQSNLILDVVKQFAGIDAQVYLFGSRLNDQLQGGDIDLFIESDQQLSLIQRAQIKMRLESLLGLPVDILSKGRHKQPTPFQVIAQSTALRLFS